MSRVFPTSSITLLWSVHSTRGVFIRWWRRRSNYGIIKYHNPPVRLVGQSQLTPSLSPAYTVSRSSVSGVSLNGKHKKIRTGPCASLRLSRLPFSLEEGKVRPALVCWLTLNAYPETSPKTYLPVWQLMPLIELLTAIENQAST